MTERTLTTALKNALRTAMPGAVVIKHHDAITAGVPDLSVTWRGTTTWLEVKFLNPRLLKRPLQHQVMLSLEREGSALYVLYLARPFPHSVICLPSQVDTHGLEAWTFESSHSGYAQPFVAGFIKSLHQGRQAKKET
jgi:hypothetical protein